MITYHITANGVVLDLLVKDLHQQGYFDIGCICGFEDLIIADTGELEINATVDVRLGDAAPPLWDLLSSYYHGKISVTTTRIEYNG